MKNKLAVTLGYMSAILSELADRGVATSGPEHIEAGVYQVDIKDGLFLSFHGDYVTIDNQETDLGGFLEEAIQLPILNGYSLCADIICVVVQNLERNLKECTDNQD